MKKPDKIKSPCWTLKRKNISLWIEILAKKATLDSMEKQGFWIYTDGKKLKNMQLDFAY